MTKPGYFQRAFLEEILKQFPKKVQAVEALQKLLGKEKNAIYRRIKGDAVLTPDELFLLAQHFQVSVDQLIAQNSQQYLFTFINNFGNINAFEDWLTQIHANIKELSELPNLQAYYATIGLPLYLYCMSPKLLAFRLYVFGLSSWNLEYYKTQNFKFDLLSEESAAKAKAFAEIYTQVPTKEIWNHGIIDNSQHPIETLCMMGKFANPEDALVLCDEMLFVLQHAQNMAAEGVKFMPAHSSQQEGLQEFDLYYNEFPNAEDFIYTTSDLGDHIFSSFGSPNYLISADAEFCSYTKNWFHNSFNHSISISKHSLKNRKQFFNMLEKKVLASRKRIENIIEDMY